MRIPYDKFQLTLALLEVFRNDNLEEKLKLLDDEVFQLEDLNKAVLNKKVAENNGISVLDLINSPNYTTLVGEYQEESMKEGVSKMREILDITDIQAWALFAHAVGLI